MKLLKVLAVMFFVGLIFGNQAQAQNQNRQQSPQANNHSQNRPPQNRPPQGNLTRPPQNNWNGNNHWNNGRWNGSTNWNVNIGVGPGWNTWNTWNGGCWNCWNTWGAWGPGPIIYQQSAPVIMVAPPVIVQPTIQQRLAQVDQWLVNGQITFDQAAQMRVNIFNGQYSNFNQ